MPNVTYDHEEKVRTWGGWYRHTIVKMDGVEIGRIQTRRRNKRTDCMTIRHDALGGGAVLGSDVKWLIDCATAQQNTANNTITTNPA